MNLITLILTIAILFGLTDFLTERYPRLQRDIFYIAWFVVAFLFTIKYYYGPDIWGYVPFYETIQHPRYVLAHPDELSADFELGYAMFCSLLKSWGVSFYWMTAIVSIFYFVAVALLFKHIDRKQSFALAILVVLDYKCIFATYRQCLAVSCFILMILCLRNKRYLWMAIWAILTAFFHKSGIFVVGVVLFYYMIRSKWVQPYLYQLLLIVLVLIFLLPIAKISSGFIAHLPLPGSYLQSLAHHLTLGRQVQVVFLVYAATLVCVTHFSQYHHTRMQAIAAAAFVGLVVVSVLYQYYYLLERIRSYFLPIVIVGVFNQVQSAENTQKKIPYGTLMKQLCSVLIFVFMIHSVYKFHVSTSQLKNNVYKSCTVFELIDHRSSDIQNAQMKLAYRYWKEDFMKNENNRIQ